MAGVGAVRAVRGFGHALEAAKTTSSQKARTSVGAVGAMEAG